MEHDGRKLSKEARQERRTTIVRLRKASKSYRDIQEATGASPDLISRTWTAWKAGGKKAITIRKSGRKTGENRRLAPEQEQRIRRLIIDRCPDQLKLDVALWNRIAVGQWIEQEYGIDMPIRTVGDYLKRWGFTPQKGPRFAMERKPEKVHQWLTETSPALSRRAKAEDAEIYWGDENLSMVSAITNRGNVNPKTR